VIPRRSAPTAYRPLQLINAIVHLPLDTRPSIVLSVKLQKGRVLRVGLHRMGNGFHDRETVPASLAMKKS
jgi:hypothetical protein